MISLQQLHCPPLALKGRKRCRQTGGVTFGTFYDIFIYEVVYLLPFFLLCGSSWVSVFFFFFWKIDTFVSWCLLYPLVFRRRGVRINNGALVEVKGSAQKRHFFINTATYLHMMGSVCVCALSVWSLIQFTLPVRCWRPGKPAGVWWSDICLKPCFSKKEMEKKQCYPGSSCFLSK